MLTELTIDRSTWACPPNNAKRGGRSRLEDNQGFKCCLGSYALACGMPTRYSEGIITCGTDRGFGTLWSVPKDRHTPALHPMLLKNQSDFITVNDDALLSNEEREAKLTKLFAAYGVKVTFVGEYLCTFNGEYL